MAMPDWLKKILEEGRLAQLRIAEQLKEGWRQVEEEKRSEGVIISRCEVDGKLRSVEESRPDPQQGEGRALQGCLVCIEEGYLLPWEYLGPGFTALAFKTELLGRCLTDGCYGVVKRTLFLVEGTTDRAEWRRCSVCGSSVAGMKCPLGIY